MLLRFRQGPLARALLLCGLMLAVSIALRMNARAESPADCPPGLAFDENVEGSKRYAEVHEETFSQYEGADKDKILAAMNERRKKATPTATPIFGDHIIAIDGHGSVVVGIFSNGCSVFVGTSTSAVWQETLDNALGF